MIPKKVILKNKGMKKIFIPFEILDFDQIKAL
jgi:hypothetical protein